MFVSHEKNASKKTFQKPNILRRKHKPVPGASISKVNLSSETKYLVSSTQNVDKTCFPSTLHSNHSGKHDVIHKTHNTRSILKSNIDNSYEDQVVRLQEADIVVSINDNGNISSNILVSSDFTKRYDQNTLNIDYFINNTGVDKTIHDVKSPVSSASLSTETETKWALDLTNTSVVDVINNYNVHQFVDLGIKTDAMSSLLSPTIPVENTSSQQLEVCTSTPSHAISVELFSKKAVKFKCDEPNCDKGFCTKEKLTKHKNWHSKQCSVRPQSQILIECPVKKILSDGVEEKCPLTFNVRRDLLKHLNDDHTPEDALHKCDVCGRRFFWASGLRAHSQSVCARGGLACAWPGCDRVFRLPCRLREHARVHTGDRPYLCHYPAIENVETFTSSASPSSEVETEWALDLTNTSVVDVINTYAVSSSLSSIAPVQNTSSPLQVVCTSTPNRAVSVELFSNRAVKFKCDEPNCDKGFWTKEKLTKHKNWHSKQCSIRPQSQILIECPVKKILSDGVEEKCPRTFNVRRDLLKHLNDDHTPEDALHKCDVCGRRFFWASGLRAHGQSVCARGGLACAWPGCDRVFRLPCRLREHARAHTGDRPYLCHYPDCGWAFRSASKLVRHARRHTGERRHACASCGRAFLRPEHLRDHARRHHAPSHLCHHPGCEQSFTNLSTLYMHMKKVHRIFNNESVSHGGPTQPPLEIETTANICLEDEASSGAQCADVEGHAARTHCTWPLMQHDRRQHESSLLMEDHVQVENSESSASNVYTVRSDLFLHGNVLIDEDSQNIGGTEIVEEEETNTALHSDLCLINSHPTVDLMQEELMYEDAAVDESSFRVFLMNGEDLT